MMSVIGVSGSNHHSVDYPWCFIEEEHQNLIHSYIYFQFLVSYCLSIKLMCQKRLTITTVSMLTEQGQITISCL